MSTQIDQTVCVVGLGYIGLPTSVMFANHGVRVHGCDINERAVAMIQNKQLHIEETGLQERLNEAIDSGRFTASTSPQPADVFIIAVPSPINPDKTANLEYVREATASIVPHLRAGNLVVLESTVPPRTVEDVMMPELAKAGLALGEELFVAHSPERVIPGRAFEELVHNDRIVGGLDAESARRTKALYETFVQGTIHLTDATTAELVKVIENTYRDINIAFANELAKISEQLGVDVWEAIHYANFHPRVNIHFPGPGVGGHCIAVDPWFLVEQAPDLAKLIKLARDTNDGMPEYTAQRAKAIVGTADAKIAVLGLAFKANVDDMRESPSVDVIERLQAAGFRVASYDPHILQNMHPTQTQSFADAADGASLLLVLTGHDEFAQLDPASVSGMAARSVYDAKHALDRAKWASAGFAFYALGDAKNGPAVG